MKHRYQRMAGLALCLALSMTALSGCITGHSFAGTGAEKAIAEALMNNDLGITDSILSSIPSFEEIMAEKDRPDEHRETVEYKGAGEMILNLETNEATQLILRQNGPSDSDTYRFEYDPAVFDVTPTVKDGELTLKVEMLKKSPVDSNGNYKFFLTLPNREYSVIQGDLSRTGLALDGIFSPIELSNQSCGIVLSNCTGSIDIQEKEGALAADVPASYNESFSYKNENGAFVVRFLDGEPEHFRFKTDSEGGIMVKPSGWGDDYESFDYQKGSGGAFFDFSIKGGAGVISRS